MDNRITAEEIKDDPSFWNLYMCWFRGYDKINELNMDESLEVIGINNNEIDTWHNKLFNDDNKNAKAIGGILHHDLSFEKVRSYIF